MLLLFLLLATDGGPSPSPSPGGCAQAISPENAQSLYAALKDLNLGCALDEVRTEKDVLRVEWKKGGAAVPAAEVRPAICAQGSMVSGPEFSLSVPAATVEACPAEVEKLKSLIVGGGLGGALRLGKAAGSKRGLYGALAGGAALLLAAAALVMWRRRRA